VKLCSAFHGPSLPSTPPVSPNEDTHMKPSTSTSTSSSSSLSTMTNGEADTGDVDMKGIYHFLSVV